jgi:hypothetical protein
MDKKAVMGAVLIAWAAALQVRHSHDFSRAMLFVSFSLSVCARMIYSLQCHVCLDFFLSGKVEVGQLGLAMYRLE